MHKSVMRLLAFPMLIGAFYSCQSNKNKTEKAPGAATATIIKAMDTSAVAVEEAPQVDSNFKNFPADFGNDSIHYPAAILTTGQFHEDEVSNDDVNRSWYGLFQNKEGYYLDSTGITTTRVHDGVADDEGQATAWEVKTNNTDTSLLLFAGVDGLSKRKITSAVLSKQEILPGEKVSFIYNGIVYTLYATGDKKKDPDSDSYFITSYQLLLKATINGTERRQLLMSARILDETMIKVLFAGDIDGDTVPDLIINTSWHYNAEAPTLYLSKPADKAQILKITGMHVSVGC
jgi:hypothetical protein